MIEKRKTKTSAAVKNRYNNKAYGTVLVRINKDLVAAFKEKCLRLGVSQAHIIRRAIEQFLEEPYAQAADDERPFED